jgi:hypothetical protein
MFLNLFFTKIPAKTVLKIYIAHIQSNNNFRKNKKCPFTDTYCPKTDTFEKKYFKTRPIPLVEYWQKREKSFVTFYKK